MHVSNTQDYFQHLELKLWSMIDCILLSIFWGGSHFCIYGLTGSVDITGRDFVLLPCIPTKEERFFINFFSYCYHYYLLEDGTHFPLIHFVLQMSIANTTNAVKPIPKSKYNEYENENASTIMQTVVRFIIFI